MPESVNQENYEPECMMTVSGKHHWKKTCSNTYQVIYNNEAPAMDGFPECEVCGMIDDRPKKKGLFGK